MTDLIREAMDATVDPVCEARRPGSRKRTVPPERRAYTCFAGWWPHEIRAFLEYLVDGVGIKETAIMLEIDVSTVRKGLKRKDVAPGESGSAE